MYKDTAESKLFLLKEQQKQLKKEIRYLKRKLKDTQISRANWKAKAKSSNLQGVSAPDSPALFGGGKAKGHSYSLLLVAFCANMQSYGAMSLRSCVHILLCLQLAVGRCQRIPSHSSIRVWVCKLGKHRIESGEPSAELWVYWVDESIHIGNQKVLLVLGIPEGSLRFGFGLTLSELRILHMSVDTQWKGEQIAEVLESLTKKYPLSYIVSDQGNNLRKSYGLTGSLHIPDCTHALSKGLEKAYKDKAVFKEFCAWAALLRKKWSMKKDRKAYLPPNQRSKVRFANLFPLVEWAKKQLGQWDALPQELREDFSFLDRHKEWVLAFWSIQEKLVETSLILKLEGYSLANEARIKSIVGAGQTAEEQAFSACVLDYLSDLSGKMAGKDKLYCCSDVIESAFGKLKQKLPKNSDAMTSFIFTLASIGGHYQSDEVRDALESIREKDIKKPPRRQEE